jgi:hypothetical protein
VIEFCDLNGYATNEVPCAISAGQKIGHFADNVGRKVGRFIGGFYSLDGFYIQ